MVRTTLAGPPMQWVYRWIAAMLAFVVLGGTSAAASEAQLTVIAHELEAGQVGGVRVRVTGDRPTAPPRIIVNPSVGLNLAFEGQSQRVNILNSNVSRFYEYTYRVEALLPGTYTIGPAQIEIGTTRLRTQSAEIRVRPRAGTPDEVLQVTAGFDVQEAWAGQVVVYRRGLRSRYRVMQDNWTDPPLDGLIPPRDGDSTYTEYVLRDPQGGDVFVKEEYHPKVVVAPGERKVPAAVARVSLAVPDGRSRSPFAMGRRKTEVMLTEAGSLQVLALPPPPKGFSGLVGDFSFETSLDRTQAAVGESVNQKVMVRGDGALEGFSLPKPDNVTGVRIYDGSPATTARVGADGYQAEGVFDRVFVPTEQGTLQIPPAAVITFSPSRKEYVTHELTVPALTVRAGKGGAATFESFTDSDDPEHSDELFEEQPYEGVRDVQMAGVANALWIGDWMPWALSIAVAPFALLLGVQGVSFGARWIGRRRRTERAPKEITPRQRLARLPADPRERLAELDAALRHSLARKQGVAVQRLDRERLIAELDDELSTAVATVTQQLDRARFADQLNADLEDSVKDLIGRLERR
ncbi:MAG: BatD family protein [Myxococcota bacterium]